MTGYNEFLNTFGSLTVANVVQIILAIIFGVFVYKRIKEYLIKRHEAELKLVNAIEDIPKIKTEIDEIKKIQVQQGKQLNDMQEMSDRRERNKLRDKLLQNFRFYTNDKSNPLKAWTSNEADTFWDLFKDYEDAGGDGFIHTDVQPAMNRLNVIDISDIDSVVELMQSRK